MRPGAADDTGRAAPEAAPPLSAAERARGRRIAFTSHPAGMTFWTAFTQHLPTLALVSLGASETQVGLQNSLMPGFQVLQLLALRAVARFAKRHILVAGQVVAVAAAVPLVFFERLAEREAGAPLVALASLAFVAIGLNIGQTVWFPLLRSYVEPERIGRFFGLLRSGWNLTLIVYFLAAQRWLAHHPDDFGPLFGVAWLCGALRIALVARLPERSERTGQPILAAQALALVRASRAFRRYLAGVSWTAALRHSVIPFAIVMMRREIGFSTAEVVYTTVATFAGSFVSLYLWGHIADRVGAEPVFRWTCLGMAALTLALIGPQEPGRSAVVAMTAIFFGLSLLTAGFSIADTRLLFELAPPEAPARMLVAAQVVVNGIAGAAPIAVGFALDRLLEGSEAPLEVYRAFFVGAAVLQALAFWPLRYFRGPGRVGP